MKCVNCHQDTESIKSVIERGKVITGCPSCLYSLTQGTELSAQNKREHMKREYAGDLVQPIEKDFAKRYGAAKAKEVGWSDEQIRKYT